MCPSLPLSTHLMRPPRFFAELVIFSLVSTLVIGVDRSPGCEPGRFRAHEDGLYSVEVHEDLGPNTRWFWLQAPKGVGQPGSAPAALLLSFHGQGDNAKTIATKHSYKVLGEQHNFLTAFPQGLDDYSPAWTDQGTGWNVGTAGDDNTCVPAIVGNESSCYESCIRQHKCGPCNWATCHDDVAFVEVVIKSIVDALCIDLSRIYVSGQSNGAMFVHYLTHQMPGRFAAAIPWYGLPLLGHSMGKEYQLVRQGAATRRTAMLQMHGRNDHIMPVEGGLAPGEDEIYGGRIVKLYGGWIYTPLQTLLSGWAAIHGCDSKPSAVSTPFDGSQVHFACVEFLKCSSGRRVMYCLYDGVHGDPAPQSDAVTVWFMLQHSLDGALQRELFAADPPHLV